MLYCDVSIVLLFRDTQRGDSPTHVSRLTSNQHSLQGDSIMNISKAKSCRGINGENDTPENPGSQPIGTPEQPLIDLRDRPSPDVLRVLAIGSPPAVQFFVMTLFRYGYARPEEWSRQLPTVNPGEVMQILTKRISLFE